MGIPSSCCGFQPLDDLCRTCGALPGQSTANQDALNRLRHIQPTACNRRIERHHALLHQPMHQFQRLVPTQIVQHQQHPQRWQRLPQRPFHAESFLPVLPDRSIFCRWQRCCHRQSVQHFEEGLLQPWMQHGIRAARDPTNPDVTAGRVKEDQQLGRSSADILVWQARGLALGLPGAPRMSNGLIGSGFILNPHRQATRFKIRALNQFFFASASGSRTTTTPAFRTRLAVPVSHQVRFRCHVRPASCKTDRMVKVLSRSNPGSRRSILCKVDSDQVAVPSCSRSGVRRAVSKMRFRSAEP